MERKEEENVPLAGAPAPVNRRPFGGALRRPASTTIIISTVAVFVVSWIVQPQSLSHSSIIGMLPFAGVLALAAGGQTLVIQQRGIDLSVPGQISLAVVIVTAVPAGSSSKLLGAILLAFGVALASGIVTGILVSKIRITPIVTTLGMNAVLYGIDTQLGQGIARQTTPALHAFAVSTVIGLPTPTVIAAVLVIVVGLLIKGTAAGRWFEASGVNGDAARAAGIEPGRYKISGYIGASLLYCCAGILLAGIVSTPDGFEGDSYLLPSVAAVVLGGTSLLGGKGSVIASGIGALFLSQLDQLILTTGVNTAITYLVQAAALAAGVLMYSFGASTLRRRLNFSLPTWRNTKAQGAK